MAKFDLLDSDDPEVLTKHYVRAYLDLKANRENRVREWRWASNVMYDPRPFGILMEEEPGTWLRQKSKGLMPCQYGLGPTGEFLVERIYMGHHFREQFFFANRSRVVAFSYPYDFKELDWVSVTSFSDGQALSHTRFARNSAIGRLDERYLYSNGLLRQSICREVRCGYPWEYVMDFNYDTKGQISRIETEHPDGREVVYERRRGAGFVRWVKQLARLTSRVWKNRRAE